MNGNDQYGPFFRWGYHGKKYYYILYDQRSKNIAFEKASRQGRAIHASRR